MEQIRCECGAYSSNSFEASAILTETKIIVKITCYNCSEEYQSEIPLQEFWANLRQKPHGIFI